jgi:hypothetical protein
MIKSLVLVRRRDFPPTTGLLKSWDAFVNVLNMHKIDLARKYYTHLQREIEKEEAR